MLFKRSKHPFNNEPTTPKFKSVALPPTPTPLKPSSSWKITRSASVLHQVSPDQQSTVPHRGSLRHRNDPSAGYATDVGYGRRERNVSMRAGEDEICKPAKATYNPSHTTGEMLPNTTEKPAKRSGWLKSAMKGGSYYLPTGKATPSPHTSPTSSQGQEHTSKLNAYTQAEPGFTPPYSHLQPHPGPVPSSSHHQEHIPPLPTPHSRVQDRQMLPPQQVVNADPYYRSRHQSLSSRHQPQQAPVAYPSNYVPAYVRRPSEPAWAKAPVSLNWPLTEYASRIHQGKPMIFYDIGFDPDWEGYEVKAHRYPCFSKLTKEERNLPVSVNAYLTEMTIYCRGLEAWPVVVRASKGGLRCIDVFKAIYDTYSQRLTRDEMSTMVNPEYLERCRPHFKQRCADAPGLSVYNERQGFCRVDLLRGRRVFQGLVPDPTRRDMWQLVITDVLSRN